MNADDIRHLIAGGLNCDVVEVEGDGSHWFATIVSAHFEGLRPLQRQRLINDIVRAQLDNGSIHALSMKTYTPAQWAQLNEENA